MNRLAKWTCIALGLSIPISAAGAVPVDGVLDPGYGAALSTQTTQTSLGLSPSGSSELDEAFGYVGGDTLHLLIAGNYSPAVTEPLVFPHLLQLFIDVGPGGQNTVSDANPSVGLYVNLQTMAGMRFDAAFAPDFWLAADRATQNRVYAYYAELPAAGGGAGYFLGSSPIGGPGTLTGGASNPFGILAAIDISNSAGVTAGCDAASGAGVTTGVEWAIPLAAIGNPAGSIRICALLASASGSAVVSNQVLGPVPPGTCALGPANGVDLGTVPGTQYFAIDEGTPAATATWGRLKTLFR
jgi:hypothetical protein